MGKDKKYYCFLCGNDLIVKKIEAFKCPKCKRLEYEIHTDKIENITYYYLYCACSFRSFKKKTFNKGMKNCLFCPVHKDDFVKIEKTKSKTYIIKTKIGQPKPERFLGCFYEIRVGKDDISFFRKEDIEDSTIVKTLQLKEGDKIKIRMEKR